MSKSDAKMIAPERPPRRVPRWIVSASFGQSNDHVCVVAVTVLVKGKDSGQAKRRALRVFSISGWQRPLRASVTPFIECERQNPLDARPVSVYRRR